MVAADATTLLGTCLIWENARRRSRPGSAVPSGVGADHYFAAVFVHGVGSPARNGPLRPSERALHRRRGVR